MTFDDDFEAIRFLEGRGYTHTKPPLPAFHWLLPTPNHTPTYDENAALDYLFDEWDYGGVIGDRKSVV